MNGNDTENSRTASSTYASATSRISGDLSTVSKPIRRSVITDAWTGRQHRSRTWPRKPGELAGSEHEEDRLHDDERLTLYDPGHGTGDQRPEEAPGDRRAGQEREEPFRLACIERGAADGPGDREGDRARGEHGEPDQWHQLGRADREPDRSATSRAPTDTRTPMYSGTLGSRPRATA